MVLFFGLNQIIFQNYKKKHPFFSMKLMNILYVYHLIFFGVYLWYAFNNPSDSVAYYAFVSGHEGNWFDTFGTDVDFIHFLAYPFYLLGFSYEMLMLTFSWLGFLGFVYSYLFFREKIPVKVKVFGVDFLTLILFFPNMHFWTSSLGKGSTIFLGLMMFTYAIINPKSRIFLLILGSFIIFHVRPHVFMFVAVGAVLGYMSGKEKISFRNKALIFIGLTGVLIFAQDQILAVVNLQGSDNLVEDFQNFSEDRSEDLMRAGSGVDMSSYPLPLKLFTFWFRPLFIDAPNVLGLIISVENLIYLLITLKIIKKDFIKFLKKSSSMVKMSFVIFLMTSFAMTFIMSNLGIIMRQKSMVMYYLFFVIYYYLAQKKYTRLMIRKRLRIKQENDRKNVDALQLT